MTFYGKPVISRNFKTLMQDKTEQQNVKRRNCLRGGMLWWGRVSRLAISNRTHKTSKFRGHVEIIRIHIINRIWRGKCSMCMYQYNSIFLWKNIKEICMELCISIYRLYAYYLYILYMYISCIEIHEIWNTIVCIEILLKYYLCVCEYMYTYIIYILPVK